MIRWNIICNAILDDKKETNQKVSIRPIRDDEKEIPEFETSILLHNLALAHLGMSIVCSYSSGMENDDDTS
jgi:hypothetical protein